MESGAPNRWHELLHRRFRGQATPLLVLPDTLWSAASQWAGARAWIRAFRAAGVGAGDRVVCALPAGAGFVQVLLACLWEGVTFAPVDAGADLHAVCLEVRPRVVVAQRDAVTPPSAAHWIPDGAWQPPDEAPMPVVRAQDGDASPAVLLRTSGSSGTPRWIGLSNDNLFAVLDSHREALALERAVVLSVLPWHHAFGLVLGLLASLRDASEIVVAHGALRDADALAELVAAHPITHVDVVPALVDRWTTHPVLHRLLQTAHGVIGGAPVTPSIAVALSGSRFRVGYGQTEASPGIMLGEPGAFTPGGIGVPLGCEVRTDADGQLLFRGPNACDGMLIDGAWRALARDRWHATGDRVSQQPDGTWCFVERVTTRVKLPNGRWLDCGAIEQRLRATPGIADAAVLLVDATVCVCWTGTHPSVHAALGSAFGSATPCVNEVHAVAAADWPVTAKGTTDRAALQSWIRRERAVSRLVSAG